jgi:predicted alpha/beta superfamily hydrolase
MDLCSVGRCRRALVSFAAVSGGVVSIASSQEFPRVSLRNTEVRTITSRHVDQEYEIDVWLPRGYAAGKGRYPVVYVLDAEYNFGCVSYIARRLIKSSDIPEVLVVGVAYDTTYEDFYAKRSRDLTPVQTPSPEGWESGGADKFSSFLREELIPFVNESYRTIPDDRTIVGHSYGGLYCLYALFEQSDLFQRFVVVSPSIWYAGGLVHQYEKQYSERSHDLAKTLFVAAAEDEPNIPIDVFRLKRSLASRAYPGLALKVALELGENHRSVFPIAFTRGLRYVFGARPGAVVAAE